MQYKLITTKQGLVPIEQIKQGTEVLCQGVWKKAPNPVVGKAIKVKFDTLPTTIFAYNDVADKIECQVNHNVILNKHTECLDQLSIRGYLDENADRKYGFINLSILNENDISYWFRKMIKYTGYTLPPTIKERFITFYSYFPKLVELVGPELSERNLEYYLEGLLRRRLRFSDNFFNISILTSESDKLVIRLLDIDAEKLSLSSKVLNEINFLKHIKDDFNKNRIPENMIVLALIRYVENPPYTPGFKIIEKKEVEDYILPDINPDINTIAPYNGETIKVRKVVYTTKTDSKNRKLKYNENNFYENLLKQKNL